MENKILQDFWQTFEEKNKQKTEKQIYAEQVIKRKELLLIPMRVLLKKFVDAELIVESAENFGTRIGPSDSKPFQVYEGPSSPYWSPGTSLYFDHPATVEIAIPNDQNEHGIILVKLASYHPDHNLLDKKFLSIDDACQALTRFIAKNTISLKNPKSLK